MRLSRIMAAAAVLAVLAPLGQAAPLPSPAIHLKPYRVLLIGSVQMRDGYVIHDAWDFGDIAALLKLWGVPFDVMRLDSHPMKPGDFVNSSGRAKYGVIIWTARSQSEHPWLKQDYRLVEKTAVKNHISIIAVGNKIQEKPIQSVLGLRYVKFGPIHTPIILSRKPHFVTRDLSNGRVPTAQAFAEGGPMVNVANRDVSTLASAGRWPQLTARTIDSASRTRAVWIGGDPDNVFHASPAFISILRRALVWAEGYALYKDYEKSVVLRMDDPGSSQSAYFTGWDYPQLNADDIRSMIIRPLIAHHAKLGIGFCPGYPWIPDRKLRHSVTIDFVDPRGVRQNIVSEYAGLQEGMKAGVLEIQSHGLTHMPPDLDSAPKNGKSWWDGDLKNEWPDEGWYREFYDQRRDREIDAATQRKALLQSADWIRQDFGRRPLAFVPGGHAISGDWYDGGSGVKSHIADNYTYKVAAEAGYGLALDTGLHYLGRDYVISLGPCTRFDFDADFARHVPCMYYFHDKDLVEDPKYLPNLLSKIDPHAHYMTMDEWVAYMHAGLDVTSPAPDAMCLSWSNDKDYCRYFADHPSVWTLHLSDDLREDLGRMGWIDVKVDGRVVSRSVAEGCFFRERKEIVCPVGLGRHSITFSKMR